MKSSSKTKLVDSQQRHVEVAKRKLRQRRIVFFQGGPDGKTTMMHKLLHEVAREENFLARHGEKWKLEVLRDLKRLPRLVTTTALQRLILDSYGKLAHYGNLLTTEKLYKKLMLQLREQKIIPVLAIDNVELLAPKHFICLKELNEYRTEDDEPAGVAVALGGDVLHSKMNRPFYEKCAEITVERLQLSREIKEVLAVVFPDHSHLFGTPVIEALKKCGSVQQMVKAADIMIDEWEEKSTDGRKGLKEMPEDLALKSTAKAQRIIRLVA